MAEPEPLLPWAFGAFHATLLVALAVAVLHWTRGLGSTLHGLGTGPGALLFAALWGLAWWTAARALQGFDLAAPRAGDAAALLGRAAGLGGLAGAATVAVAAAALGLASGAGPVAVLLAGFGALFGFAGGLVVGALLGALDARLVALATRLAPAPAEPAPAAAGGGEGQTFMPPGQV